MNVPLVHVSLLLRGGTWGHMLNHADTLFHVIPECGCQENMRNALELAQRALLVAQGKEAETITDA